MKCMSKVKIILQGMAMGMDVTMMAGTTRHDLLRRTDAEALRSDWKMVAKYLHAAIAKYELTKQP